MSWKEECKKAYIDEYTTRLRNAYACGFIDNLMQEIARVLAEHKAFIDISARYEDD